MVLMVHGGDGFPFHWQPCSRCLEGHLYSVCPLCIPSLSLNQDTNGGGVVEGGGGEDDENRLNDKFGNAT